MCKILLVIVSTLLLVSISCHDVLEPDIERKEVFLLAPGDSVVLTSDTVSLWWEHLDGAREYEVRMASPSLAAPAGFVVDTLTTANFLTFFLLPGQYEWEVRAINNGYSTDYFYRTFTVDTTGAATDTPDISGLSVEVLLPRDMTELEVTSVTFWWETLEGAEEYEVRAVSPGFTAPQSVLVDSTLTSNKFTISILPGDYQWQVRGKNPEYTTGWTTSSFSVVSMDTVPEDTTTYEDISGVKVTLLAPHDSLKLEAGNFTFWWEEVSGAEEYQLQIVSPDFKKIVRLVLDDTMTENQHEQQLDSGHYQWRVRAVNPEYKTDWSTYTLFAD